MASVARNAEPDESQTNNTGGDSAVLNMKHLLQDEWAFWFFKNDKARDWSKNQKYITSFSTVEDFWAIFNHIQPVSSLPAGCDYSLFKEGIEPMWEDAANVNGGRWVLQTTKVQRSDGLDTFWREVLLLLVGDMFLEDSEEICGAVVQVRMKGDKLAVWTRSCKKEVIARIGAKFRAVLPSLPSGTSISFFAHQDAMSKAGSVNNKPLMVL